MAAKILNLNQGHEFFERYAYYGMRTILVIYLVSGFSVNSSGIYGQSNI